MLNTLTALLLALKFANVLIWDWAYVILSIIGIMIIQVILKAISKKLWMLQMEKMKDEVKPSNDTVEILTLILGTLTYKFF